MGVGSIAALLYGAGLRLKECLELRVKDLDFDQSQILVRRGKGQKDRVTMLPSIVREKLVAHLQTVRAQHSADLEKGLGMAVLPFALDRKYPGAATPRGITFTNRPSSVRSEPRRAARVSQRVPSARTR